jgi:hypothetical protein
MQADDRSEHRAGVAPQPAHPFLIARRVTEKPSADECCGAGDVGAEGVHAGAASASDRVLAHDAQLAVVQQHPGRSVCVHLAATCLNS